MAAKAARKGKMHEVTEDAEGEEAGEDDGNYDAGEEEAEEEGVTGSLLMMPLLMDAESEPEGEAGVQLSSLILNTGNAREDGVVGRSSLSIPGAIGTGLGPLCDALLVSQVDSDDSWSWWLLDSGASVTVMAAQFIGHYSFAHLTEAGRGGFPPQTAQLYRCPSRVVPMLPLKRSKAWSLTSQRPRPLA